MCLCDQGWTKGPGQPSCSVDVDECSTGHHFCSRNPPVACINYPGGFGCAPCPSGKTHVHNGGILYRARQKPSSKYPSQRKDG
ncbi:hypothetical protein HPB50_024673 [Hyalomma asiaticum]|uniref:Uncharacterized protein n=1 Tax=Hyalomma asiaticum TaxID=266040 RepID=A0ACB7SBN9_HYAAI|nr:hypothetical protein HPB50_024673 [Hyalomma asiaticum]